MTRCDRCGQETLASTGSYFNTEQICLDCDAVEQAHPDYPEAREAEKQAVLRGDFNYAGIGLPPDLRGAK